MKHNNDNGFRALPVGTILENNYKILSVLGDGGFGITYEGFDILHKTEVAIKEYFPHEFAYRAIPSTTETVNYTIYPLQSTQKTFETGKAHFLREAIVLKNLEHLPSIVSILDILESNGTIYIVMEYIEGITLENYVQNNGALSYQELLPMILPIIKDLQQIHEKGLIHRDISPDNLILGIDNRLHLIDFGSSTHFYNTDKAATTVFLKSGYAPPEQYLKNGKQGPWVDVYGLCATMYLALTRIQPPDSLNRLQQEHLPSLTANSDTPRGLACIIEKGMSLKIADRYPSMSVLYNEIKKHTDRTKSQKRLPLLALVTLITSLSCLCLAWLVIQSNTSESATPVSIDHSSKEAESTTTEHTSTSERIITTTEHASTSERIITATEQASTSERIITTTELSSTVASDSDSVTETFTSATTFSTTSSKASSTQAKKKNTSRSTYQVRPIEEDDYHVLPMEED